MTRSHENDLHEGQPVLTSGPALGEGAGVMILVHGRGAGPESMAELARAHGVQGFTLLAPAAARNTWYPNSFLAPVDQNEPWLSSALGVLEALTDRVLAAGVPSERLVFMGFSQGACLASEFVRRTPRRYGALVAYSGGIIGPMGTTWSLEPADLPGSLDGTPVFLGCSDVDHHIPVERVRETDRVFRAMGADVEMRIYPGMGHLVNRDELGFVKGLLERVADESPGNGGAAG
jgi:phospholipase/carboxylesterase